MEFQIRERKRAEVYLFLEYIGALCIIALRRELKSTTHPKTHTIRANAQIRELQSCPFLQRTRPNLTVKQTLPGCYLTYLQ